jgi:broad specificity phosphatase PhoE
MPDALVMIRHGESEINVINRALKRGEISEYPREVLSIPDREFRLSAQGRIQAEFTGRWLKEAYPKGFDVMYVSDHVRARETAGLVCREAGWGNVLIRIDPQLGERNWGRFPFVDSERRREFMELRHRDPLHAPMPDGETLLQTRTRTRVLLERIARENWGQRVLVFSHGEYIEALWAEVGHFSTESQREFFSSISGDIKNCQVVEFSSVDPVSGERRGQLRWAKSSCPHADISGEWKEFEYQKFSPDDLLRIVEQYPHLPDLKTLPNR